MPYFFILFHAQGLEIPPSERRFLMLPEGDEMIRGFHKAFHVRASDRDAAVICAKELVHAEWEEGDYQYANRGAPLVLEVEELKEISAWRAAGVAFGSWRGFFRFGVTLYRGGFTFYSELVDDP